MRTMVVAVAAAAALLGAPAAARADGEPFRDPSLPLSARIDDLMSRLTLDEKISLLHDVGSAVGDEARGLHAENPTRTARAWRATTSIT